MYKQVIKTKAISNDIFAIDCKMVNMYLIKYKLGYIAIDCGNNMKNVKKGLNILNINPDTVTHVLLTHSDYDHVGALELFKNAQVYIGFEEDQMMNRTTPRLFKMRYNKPLACKYNLIKKTEILNELNIEVIWTPGHTKGSVSYIYNKDYIFIGDAGSIKNDKLFPFYKFFVMDMEEHKKSLEVIKKIGKGKMVLSGHHGMAIL